MRKLPFWCQKVLPLVYDGALSYYEAISKVVAKLNELISWSNGVDATVSAAGEAANEAEDKAIDALNAAERAEDKATEAKATANDAKSIAQGIAGDIPTKTSDLQNDSGFINATQAANAAPVQSVNGATGDVVITVPTKTSDLNNDSGFVNSTQAASAAPIQSVNGATGDVVITVPTKTSDLDNDSGFTTRNGVVTWPDVSDTSTITELYSLAKSRAGAFLSWFKNGTSTYAPNSDTNAHWCYTLYSKATGSGDDCVFFSAYDTNSGRYFMCDEDGTWHRAVNRDEFTYTTESSSTSVSAANNTWTDVISKQLQPGRYMFSASVRFSSNANGYRRIILAGQSGGTSPQANMFEDIVRAVSGAESFAKFFGYLYVGSQKTFYLRAYQNSGSTLTIDHQILTIISLPN